MSSSSPKPAAERGRPSAPRAALLAGALAGEAFAAAAWFSGSRGPCLFLGLHAASSLCFLGASRGPFQDPLRRNSWAFAGSLWVLLPPFGAWLASGFLLALKPGAPPASRAVQRLVDSIDEEEAFFKALSLDILAERYGREGDGRLRGAVDAQPLLDVLKSGAPEAKKRAIARLRDSRDADSIRLLRVAQGDAEYEIRFLATNALASIESAWQAEARRLAEEIELQPRSAELRNRLVAVYLLVYRSGLVSERIGEIYLDHALEHAIASLRVDPRQPRALAQLGKIRLFTGDPAGAKAAFERALALGPSEPGLRFWKAEAHYRLSEFDALRGECAALASEPGRAGKALHPRVLGSLEHWGGAHAGRG